MNVVSLHDKNVIEAFLRRNVFLNIYSIGDLDDFFWPYTSWYACTETAELKAIALIYTGGKLPCLHSHAENNKVLYAEKLLHRMIPTLPRRFHAHLSAGLESILSEHYSLRAYGKHYKMALTDKSVPSKVDTSQTIGLSKSQLSEIIGLFEQAYPGNYFEPRMLDTKQYFCLRHSGELIGIAGVHVFSRQYGVAALGNIVIHPDYRNKGNGTIVTAKVCQSLLRDIDHIGLNVNAGNVSAIKCYEKLGFEVVDSYGEFEAELRLP